MEALLLGAEGTMPLVVEIAQTPEERSLGLMHRTSMPLNRGMLFLFDAPDRHGFWMMNTLIPLDIVPITADGVLLDVLHGVPHSTDTVAPDQPVQRMLEVNAGLVKAMGADQGRGRFVVTGGTPCDPPTP